MSHDGNGTSSGDRESTSTEDIEADIARTRAELADTVDQLTAKLDVKARTKERVHDTSSQVTQSVAGRVDAVRDRVTDADGRPTRQALGTGGAAAVALVAVVALLVWRRNR